MDVDDVISKVRSFVKKQDSVIAAYLFGSLARGTDNPMSDIDIALLLTETENVIPRIKEFTVTLANIIDTSNLDLISLKHADLALKYNVIREGILIYESDPVERIAFERRTTTEYLDMLPVWREYDEHMKSRLQEYAASD